MKKRIITNIFMAEKDDTHKSFNYEKELDSDVIQEGAVHIEELGKDQYGVVHSYWNREKGDCHSALTMTLQQVTNFIRLFGEVF